VSALVFLDTETTGLAIDADIWEFAAVRREDDGSETDLHLFIEHDEAKCKNLPESFLADHYARFPSHGRETKRRDAAWEIYHFIQGGLLDSPDKPHVVGAVPNFDTERLSRMFRVVIEQRKDPWHHHLIDVENLVVGWLAGRGKASPSRPWDSNELSRLVGVDPDDFVRHSAMGDARWAMAIYDAVMVTGRIGGAS
jgi:hypothetical protein